MNASHNTHYKRWFNSLVAVSRAEAPSTASKMLVWCWSSITVGASQWRLDWHYGALLHNDLFHWLANQRHGQHLTTTVKRPSLYRHDSELQMVLLVLSYFKSYPYCCNI